MLDLLVWYVGGAEVTKGCVFSELDHDHNIHCSNSIPGNGDPLIPRIGKGGRGGRGSVVTVLP